MGNLADVLKKLNKDRKDEDKVSILGKTKLTRGTISTGSPYLDYLTGGGFLDGGYNIIVADGGTGKSSVALLACRDVIERKGKYAVYFDGEGTLNDSYIDRMGVNRDMLVREKGRNLEDMLDKAELYSTADDVGIIIIDSIPVFVSTVVEAKSASDNNMAVEARKYTARMPIIEGNCMNRGTGIIGLTSYKLDPGAMGDPRKLPRGQWQFTMSNTTLDLTKKELLIEDNMIVGHRLEVRVKKSKNASYDAKTAHSVNFYYDGGFKEVDEYARLLAELDIVKQGGAWITFPNKDGEALKVNGMTKFIQHLKDNQEDYEFLKEQING